MLRSSLRTRLLFLVLLLVIFPALIALCSDRLIKFATQHSHSSDLADVPSREAALVLGCAETLKGGRTNWFFRHRVNAAAALYHAQKCQYLIVSGDNSTASYNEPAAMRAALVERGVPDSRIVSDFAGFRTLDSVVRADQIFGQSDLIVVSQQFHNERAIYLANAHGISLYGYNAKNVSQWGGFRTRLREKLARVKSILDVHVTKEQPKFLGEPIPLPPRKT